MSMYEEQKKYCSWVMTDILPLIKGGAEVSRNNIALQALAKYAISKKFVDMYITVLVKSEKLREDEEGIIRG